MLVPISAKICRAGPNFEFRNHLNSVIGLTNQHFLKRNIFSADVAVQTDSVAIGIDPRHAMAEETVKDSASEDSSVHLGASELSSILRWSKDISSDINLSSGQPKWFSVWPTVTLSFSSPALRRLTEIIAGMDYWRFGFAWHSIQLLSIIENSGCQSISVVIAREAGDYTVATTLRPPEPCQVHEYVTGCSSLHLSLLFYICFRLRNPKPIHRISDSLERSVMQYCRATLNKLRILDWLPTTTLGLNQKSRVVVGDAAIDSRFLSAAGGALHRSVICLPITSNRGQMFGLVYLASNYPFTQTIVHVLTLLLQQASISIANAMLFRSVQAGTRENLKMIASQRAALEQARRSREDALKATKVSPMFTITNSRFSSDQQIKSNFLASMSHELRTPFR